MNSITKLARRIVQRGKQKNHRGARSIRKLGVVVAVAAVGLIAAPTAVAAPYFQPQRAECVYGGVRATPPTTMYPWYRDTENVAYSIDLFRWNGYEWKAYDASAPWRTGMSLQWRNMYGGVSNQVYWNQYPARLTYPTNMSQPALPHGYYALREYFKWSDAGQQVNQWATFTDGKQYCQV